MHAVLSGGLRLPAPNFAPVYGNPKYAPDREITDRYVRFTFRRPKCLISMASIGSGGGKGGRLRNKSRSSDRSTENIDEPKGKSDGVSSKSTQQELIDLFKRIQNSLAEESRADANKGKPKGLTGIQLAEAITEAPQKFLSKKQPKVSEQDSSDLSRRRYPFTVSEQDSSELSRSRSSFTAPGQDSSELSRSRSSFTVPEQDSREVSRRRSSVTVPEQDSREVSRRRSSVTVPEQDSREVSRRRYPWEENEETQTNGQVVVSRPVSKFYKRSPIPQVRSDKEETYSSNTQASTTRVPEQSGLQRIDEPKLGELKESADAETSSKAVLQQSELQRIDELKLTDLKELAKSKGVKGYSRMKKMELAELLKGLAQP